jgi:hypothetical protein
MRSYHRVVLIIACVVCVTSCSAPTPRNSSGGVAFADDFSADNNDWWVGVSESEGGKIRREIADGVYRVGISADKDWTWWITPSGRVLSDFGLQADFHKVSSVYNEAYGLTFCSSEAGRYYFLISPFGKFHLYAWDEARQEAQTLIDWTAHGAIRREGPNTLRVMRRDEGPIELFVNDQLVAALSDQRLPPGEAGVTFALYEQGQELQVEVDNFKFGLPNAVP